MSFNQCPDVIVSLHKAFNFEDLNLLRICKGGLGQNTEYQFSTRPRKSSIVTSACWRGYIAHFELNDCGNLTLRKYVGVDRIEQPVDEVLTDDFWLELEGWGHLGKPGRIRVAFEGGSISNPSKWEGDRWLLAWVRMTSQRPQERQLVGEIKWFGGMNRKTGHANNYGFVSTPEGDVYFHRSEALSPLESLTSGTQVIFERVSGRNQEFEAKSVQVLSKVSDAQLVAAIKSPQLTAEDTVIIALHRKKLSPCENEVTAAVAVLQSKSSTLLHSFWRQFTPMTPDGDLYRVAPDNVKLSVCQRHYAGFRTVLASLFQPLGAVRTNLNFKEAYLNLDERDERIAALWAPTNADASQAKMLSARAAEKAVKHFYERIGSSVEDVAIRQLDGGTDEWKTHDLLVDGTIAVDVKNARRPMNGKDFYVEHTVPRFKLDRSGRNVRIAGILSPYLQLEFLRNPRKAASKFEVDDLVFLGETSREQIDRLSSTFTSAHLEVIRSSERTIPNWVFGYPETSYRAFVDRVGQFKRDCDWPEDSEWQHVLSDSEKVSAIPGLCVAGVPLPRAIASKLSPQQLGFYERLQVTVGSPPALPAIFLTVLSDFLERLKEDDPGYSPQGYLPILFPNIPRHSAVSPDMRRASGWPPQLAYPLGAIDPLGLVRALVDTLTALWLGRKKTSLARFSSFRFGGLGILQGREATQARWMTLVAYCGGTIYQTDESGTVLVNDEGEPKYVKGKCGRSPLVIGRDRTCVDCGKLICSTCGFCSDSCQSKLFQGVAATNRRRQTDRRPNIGIATNNVANLEPPGWWDDLPPLDAYESYR